MGRLYYMAISKAMSRFRVTIDGVLISDSIDNLHTRLGTTTNYSATANLNNSQITTASVKFSSLLCPHQPFPGNGF
jgi:hypothetical protein